MFMFLSDVNVHSFVLPTKIVAVMKADAVEQLVQIPF